MSDAIEYCPTCETNVACHMARACQSAVAHCAAATRSASSPRFSRRDDTDNLCSAMYRGHGIACARHWRHKHVWLCQVVNAAGELVADYRHEGHDRRAMLIGAARAAGLLPNT